MKLDGQVVAVTGASGNLGIATSRVLVAQGASLLLLDREPERIQKVLSEPIEQGRAHAFGVDLTDEASAAAALSSGVDRTRRLDGIVCTVGGYKSAPLSETPWGDWQGMLDMNLKTAVACTRAALPRLLEQGSGSIVFVASLAAVRGTTGQAAYSAAKGALLRFAESVADETKSRGVRVNAVLPGTIDTPQNRVWMSEEQAKLAVDPTAIAEVIAFLLSDAARAVTGAAIPVTGRQ